MSNARGRRSQLEVSYALFLGAGTSAALAAYLEKATQGAVRAKTTLPTSGSFLKLLDSEIPASVSHAAADLWKSMTTEGYRNVEELIQDLDALIRCAEVRQQILTGAYKTAKGAAKGYVNSPELLRTCKDLRKAIHESIFKYYSLPHGNQIDKHISDFFSPLLKNLDSIFGGGKDLVIVTTNIDLAVERFFCGKYAQNRFAGLLDGFSRAPYPTESVWKDEFHASPSDRAKKLGMLALVKLHGSLNWYYTEDSGTVARLPAVLPRVISLDQKQSAFLYPAYEKDIVGRQLYSDLFFRLDEFVGLVPKWLFVGFAFKDPWINNALDHAFRRSSGKEHLLVIGQSASSTQLPASLQGARLIDCHLENLRHDFSPIDKAVSEPQAKVHRIRAEAHVAVTGSIAMKLKRPNLVAYWRLTDESVDVENRRALDIGPNGLDGIIIGAEFRERRMLYFDGVHSLIDIGSYEKLIPSRGMSVIARVQPENLQAKRDQVILASQGETDVDFIFGIDPDSHLFLELNADGNYYDLAVADVPLDSNEHYVAVTANWNNDASSLSVCFYIDGKDSGRKNPWAAASITPLIPGQGKLPMYVTIGASMPGVDLYNGYLSDVQLYDAALDAAVIRSLHGAA